MSNVRSHQKVASFWQPYSFEPSRWHAVFGGEIPEAKKYLVASMWDGDTDKDLPDPEQDLSGYLDCLWQSASPDETDLAEHITRNGLSYKGLSREKGKLLDRMVVCAFSPEGLEPLLKSSSEQEDSGFAPREVDELLTRRETVRVGGFLGFGGATSIGHATTVIQWLLSGRRFDTNEPTSLEARYVIFNRDEVKQAVDDLLGLLAVNRPWRTPEFQLSIRKELLAPLERVLASNKHFAATYCP